ncbi:MAG: DUF192 domain-containing protein [Parcubacteria group bacterium]|nr:DUF192 domain-containing protein [Parcubacteria group bacterium]
MKKNIMIILTILLIIIFLSIYFVSKNKKTEIFFPKQNIKIEAQLAQTILQQTKGLMNVKNLPENQGMLFVFLDESRKSFWMKNTYIPLDLIFISRDKKIVEIKENFEPCQQKNCPSYTSQKKAKYVLEVNGGFCQKHQIKEGDEVRFEIK